jgi:hypothetical protein
LLAGKQASVVEEVAQRPSRIHDRLRRGLDWLDRREVTVGCPAQGGFVTVETVDRRVRVTER